MSKVVVNRFESTEKSRGRLATLLSMFWLAAAGVASAAPEKTALPQTDKPASADDPLLGRYSGSVILVYEQRSRGDAELPLGKFEPLQEATGAPLRPSVTKQVEGQRTHFLYYAGKEASPLEVVRSYQEVIKAQGGNVLFECKEGSCGGSPIGNVFYGGKPGVLDYLYPNVPGVTAKVYPPRSPEWCGMYVPTERLQFSTLELAGGNGYSIIAAYSGGRQVPSECSNFTGGTFVSVDLVDTSPRKSRMVTVSSTEIASALQGSGKIALYGLYFDFDKADVKPESDATLEQIAKLMKDKPGLKLMVVGHTDNIGNFDANMGLSQRRATAVVEELSARYGIKPDRLRPIGVSYAAPVAPNKTEEGRAKNRRVELVEQ